MGTARPNDRFGKGVTGPCRRHCKANCARMNNSAKHFRTCFRRHEAVENLHMRVQSCAEEPKQTLSFLSQAVFSRGIRTCLALVPPHDYPIIRRAGTACTASHVNKSSSYIDIE